MEKAYSQTPARLYFIGLVVKAEGKKILSVANWECGRFPTGSVWVLTSQSKVERHDTTSSLTPMLIYSQRRQKKNNINNCFSRRITALLLLYISACVCAHKLVIPCSQMLLQCRDWTWLRVAGAMLALKSQFTAALVCLGSFFFPISFTFPALLFVMLFLPEHLLNLRKRFLLAK